MASPADVILPRQRSTRFTSLILLAQFALLVVSISFFLSLIALPLTDLSWLQTFRRCVSIASAISLWIMIKRVQRLSFSAYGLSSWHQGRWEFGLGILLGLSALVGILAVGLLTNSCAVDLIPDSAKLWRTVLGFIPAAVLVGILEELVFRGFIFQQLRNFSAPAGFTISSILYAVVHLKHPSWTVMVWMELFGLFFLGMLLCYCVWVTKRLWLSIGLHASLAYGARVNKLLLYLSDVSREWLVGTSRLVNGVAAWVVLAAIAVVIAFWAQHTQQRRLG